MGSALLMEKLTHVEHGTTRSVLFCSASLWVTKPNLIGSSGTTGVTVLGAGLVSFALFT